VSWLELFFDLVVVAAVAQLAHLLRPHLAEGHGGGPGLGDAALFVALYYAIWSVWTSFTLYANVAAASTRRRTILLAMFGIAVMAAAVPGAAGTRGTIFAVAYVACRIMAARTWGGTGTLLTAWPAAQLGTGLAPWVASIWVAPPARYWLWGAGIVADIVSSLIQSFDADKTLARFRRRTELQRARLGRRGRGRLLPGRPPVAARLDPPHLRERLGLFVIIVLGEAVAQVIDAAAEVEDWTTGAGRDLIGAGVLGFGLLVALWWLALQYGESGIPRFHAHGEGPAPRLTLPAHFTMTAGITAMAAGLGTMAAHSAEHLADGARWALCGGAAGYFLTTTAIAVIAGAPLGWLLGWALPAVAVPVALGVTGGPLPAWTIAAGVLLVTAWQAAYPIIARRHRRRRAQA
jgi:low temperature requirement protein LtrA